MKKTKRLAYLALFMAIEALMVMTPFLGFIPIGPLRATTLHIPVIIASITLGKKEGSIVGLIFGLFSLINNTVNPTITSFVFSPFISGNILSAVIAIIPRVLIGYVSASLYNILKKRKYAMFISSLIGSLTNTILVLLGIYLLFGNSYSQAIGKSYSELLPYFMFVIATQSMVEAILGSIISSIVCKTLIKIK